MLKLPVELVQRDGGLHLDNSQTKLFPLVLQLYPVQTSFHADKTEQYESVMLTQ